MSLSRPTLRSLVTAATLSVAAACSSDSTDPNPTPDTTPASISVVSGNSQTGEVSTALPAPLVVRVANSAGDSLSGITVAWTVEAGGGALGSGTSTTNAQGRAQMTYTLGAGAGANTVRATVQGASISTTFSATATASMPFDSVPASITIVSGDAQSATVGQALAQPLVTIVKNAGGQSIGGITVAWSILSGGGALGAPTTTTDGSGQASNTFTVDGTPGSSTIQAAVQSNTALNASFTANATAVVNGSVTVDDNFFDPNAVNVSVGGKVTWTWAGVGGHNVTWAGGGFTNSTTQAAGTHEVTFPSAGTYTYYCTIHGSPTTGMRGTVTVQ